MVESLLQRFRNKDRRALARVLTLLSRGEQIEAILRGLNPPEKRGRVAALTGSGGVGKSTLLGKLIRLLRERGKTVAVLACDPQSPLSGGALLGDRFRMSLGTDDGVYVRSLATVGGQSAFAQYLELLIEAVQAYGFDVIFVETVGAGQGDTRIRELVDVFVLLLQPETGDDLQWEKAGVVEVADVIFVHKADLPGAEQVEAQVKNTVTLSPNCTTKILRGSSKTGQGLDDLWTAIESVPLRTHTTEVAERYLLYAAQKLLMERFSTAVKLQQSGWKSIVQDWFSGAVNVAETSRRLLKMLAEDS